MSGIAIRLALGIVGLATTGSGAAAGPVAAPDEVQVVRLQTRDEALIRRIGQMQSHMIVRRTKGEIVFEADAALRAELDAEKLPYAVDLEATRGMAAGPWQRDAQGKSIPGYACYRTVAESAARLRFLMNGADLMATKVAHRLPRQLFGRSSPR